MDMEKETEIETTIMGSLDQRMTEVEKRAANSHLFGMDMEMEMKTTIMGSLDQGLIEASEEVLFDRNIMSIVFSNLNHTELRDPSQVCGTWREVANEKMQLRSWSYDDFVGNETSVTTLKPKTPLPKQWVNPSTYSPYASFQTPKSLQNLFNPITNLRTPSPIRSRSESGGFCDDIRLPMRSGRFLGDVDIRSSRLNDRYVQMILKSCPNLQTLRLQHICNGSQHMQNELSFQGPEFTNTGTKSPSILCLCDTENITECGFRNMAELCPNLGSVTLMFQHIGLQLVLQNILAEIGRLPELHTLSIELCMPLFCSSVEADMLWLESAQCRDSELYALLNAGPPPLEGLSLNRCELSEPCIAALAAACPNLQAIELISTDWPGMFTNIGDQLKGLRNLTAAAFGTFAESYSECQSWMLPALKRMRLERLPVEFVSWSLPTLRRLRLVTKVPLTSDSLLCLFAACPKLESLHLICDTSCGSCEAHIYPSPSLNGHIYETAIKKYVRSL